MISNDYSLTALDMEIWLRASFVAMETKDFNLIEKLKSCVNISENLELLADLFETYGVMAREEHPLTDFVDLSGEKENDNRQPPVTPEHGTRLCAND